MTKDRNKRCDRCAAAQIVCDTEKVPYEWVTLMNGFESHLSTLPPEIGAKYQLLPDGRHYGCSAWMINWVEEVVVEYQISAGG